MKKAILSGLSLLSFFIGAQNNDFGALSECPIETQELVIARKFFNALVCYVTGQINGWKELNLSFVDHSLLVQGIYLQYPRTHCQPFHSCTGNCQSYEIMGER